MKLHSLATMARQRHSKFDDGAAHIWEHRRGSYIPVCMFCRTTSLKAQEDQPEAKGVGPCQKRAWLAAWPIETPKAPRRAKRKEAA